MEEKEVKITITFKGVSFTGIVVLPPYVTADMSKNAIHSMIEGVEQRILKELNLGLTWENKNL